MRYEFLCLSVSGLCWGCSIGSVDAEQTRGDVEEREREMRAGM